MVVGRPRGKYSQAFRLVKMMELLQTNRYITVQLLVDKFDVSRRTIHRDLATLQEDYSIKEDGRLPDGQKVWKLTHPDKGEIIKLTVMEMASLYMGKNLFNFTRGTQFKKSIDSIFDKLSHRLASNRKKYTTRLDSKFYCTPGSPKNYESMDDQLNEIVTGLLEEQKVSIVYRRPTQIAENDVIHPWTMVMHNHALYLIAFSETAGKVRTFAVERIQSASWQHGNSFEYPENFNPDEYFSKAFGITVGRPQTIILKVDPLVVDYFRHRLWHRSQIITNESEFGAMVNLSVPITSELLSWLLSFGDKLEVVEPLILRNQMGQMVNRMSNMYANPSMVGEPIDKKETKYI